MQEKKDSTEEIRQKIKKNGEMAEWFKAADCKSVEVSHRRFKSYSLLKRSKYGAVGSAPVLGTGGHVFKSHYFEEFLLSVNT